MKSHIQNLGLGLVFLLVTFVINVVGSPLFTASPSDSKTASQVLIETCELCPTVNCASCLDYLVDISSAFQCIKEEALNHPKNLGKSCPLSNRNFNGVEEALARDEVISRSTDIQLGGALAERTVESNVYSANELEASNCLPIPAGYECNSTFIGVGRKRAPESIRCIKTSKGYECNGQLIGRAIYNESLYSAEELEVHNCLRISEGYECNGKLVDRAEHKRTPESIRCIKTSKGYKCNGQLIGRAMHNETFYSAVELEAGNCLRVPEGYNCEGNLVGGAEYKRTPESIRCIKTSKGYKCNCQLIGRSN